MARPAHLLVKNVAVPFFAAGVIVSAVTGSKAGYAFVVLLFKDKVLEVLGDSGGSDTLGNDGGTVLNSPCDANLSRGLAELLCNTSDSRVIDSTILAVDVVTKRGVGSNMDVLLGTEVQQLLLVKSRVKFNLKSSRANTAVV
jgi:hypothetical protein